MTHGCHSHVIAPLLFSSLLIIIIMCEHTHFNAIFRLSQTQPLSLVLLTFGYSIPSPDYIQKPLAIPVSPNETTGFMASGDSQPMTLPVSVYTRKKPNYSDILTLCNSKLN
jgi:hypothetical protein